MPAPEITPSSWWWLDAAGLERLVAALAAGGYRVVGPQVADGAVVIRDLASARDLPTGWLDEQDGGTYRLRSDPAAGTFDHVVGPHSLKNFLFPARETIARFTRAGGSWSQEELARDEPPLAVIGVRACDLEALRIQDRQHVLCATLQGRPTAQELSAESAQSAVASSVVTRPGSGRPSC